MNYTINNKTIEMFNKSENGGEFPKYTSQLINLANQNAQGTRPAVVGQMSQLFQEFMNGSEDITTENWHKWYAEHFPTSIEKASEKIYSQIVNLQNAVGIIDLEMVKRWVEDLVILKTFNGLYVQKAILATLSGKKNLPYRLANKDEEAVGIDGYVGNTAYSIKPDTYKTMARLPESIGVKIIYYSKNKNGIKVEIED